MGARPAEALSLSWEQPETCLVWAVGVENPEEEEKRLEEGSRVLGGGGTQSLPPATGFCSFSSPHTAQDAPSPLLCSLLKRPCSAWALTRVPRAVHTPHLQEASPSPARP